jgi:hypothetical protein
MKSSVTIIIAISLTESNPITFRIVFIDDCAAD